MNLWRWNRNRKTGIPHSDDCTDHCVFIPTKDDTSTFGPFPCAMYSSSKFIFMTEKMIHCWIVEECTCSLIFLEQKGQPLNYEATLAVLLVVNYRFLCSGLHKPLLKVLEVRFCEHAGSCIDMYEKELSIKMSDHKKLLPSMILLIII